MTRPPRPDFWRGFASACGQELRQSTPFVRRDPRHGRPAPPAGLGGVVVDWSEVGYRGSPRCDRTVGGYRSGKKSLPRSISIPFLSAPTSGIALSPVSSVPLTSPFRRTVAAIVATAMTAPRIGTDRRSRCDSLTPPYRTSRCCMLICSSCAIRIPCSSVRLRSVWNPT